MDRGLASEPPATAGTPPASCIAAPARRECLLGVASSATGRRWLARPADERMALALAQRAGLPEIVGRVLAGRGVDLDAVDGFLNPTLRRLLPDPHHLKGMAEAAERVAAAVIEGERVAVFGDYDVDGATASALVARFLRAAGGRWQIYVPDRRKEGYGPSAAALGALKEGGASLVITVDCGTSAMEPLRAARAAGLDVIVVDHHEAEAELPPAVAIVNPNRLDEASPHRELAAVGVAFLLVVAANRTLREAGWYESRPEPDLLRWLDLVALGTVCDVVPLTGLNRALVAQGLKVMADRENLGLRTLADVARLDRPPSAYHLGFVLGPRVNAGGRVGAADLGARLLATEDAAEAAAIAHRLDALNRERQAIEAAVLADALGRVEAAGGAGRALVFAAGDGWHPGVIGLAAGRLKERFNRPAFVVALDGGTGVGSARSVPGRDVGAAVIAARQAGLLEKGGGHAMAAGFTVARARLGDFAAFLENRLGRDTEDLDAVPTLHLDGALQAAAAVPELVATLARVGPFGSGNPEPRFAVPAARVAFVKPVGDGHLRLSLVGEDGGRLNAVAFRSADTGLGQAIREHGGAPLHVAGRLKENEFRGRTSVELHVDDVAKVW